MVTVIRPSEGRHTDGRDDCPWEEEGTGQIPLADEGEVSGGGVHTCTDGIHHLLKEGGGQEKFIVCLTNII